MTINHLGIPVSDIARSKAFYTAALEPLGLQVTLEVGPDQTQSGGTAIGFGAEGDGGLFWIGDNERVGEGVHVAFVVRHLRLAGRDFACFHVRGSGSLAGARAAPPPRPS